MEVDVAKEFTNWVRKSQAADEKRCEEIKMFSAQIEKLNQEFQDVSKDLKRERVAARATQDEAETLKRRLEELQKSVEASSFVLVLIDADGDGYIFKDKYYQTVDGGRKAALDFRELIREYLKKEQPDMSNLPVMVKAFANGDGLSKLLVKGNIIKSPSSLTDFAKGFSQAYDTCDFVLVGSGKDRADVKIKGFFEQFVRNPTCSHVIFGACHDNGYVRVLEEYEQKVFANRVTLLRSFDTGKEFTGLKFPYIQMEKIFRTKPVSYHEPPALRQTLENANSATGSTWANLLSATGDTNGFSVSKKSKDLPSGSVLLNSAEQRIDTELPSRSQNAVNSWHQKTKKANMRYCRTFHLIPGSCDKNTCYSHGPLSEEEKLVFRHELRLERCYNGLQCRDPNCYFGHNCSCTDKRCKLLPEMHNVDTSSIHVSPGPMGYNNSVYKMISKVWAELFNGAQQIYLGFMLFYLIVYCRLESKNNQLRFESNIVEKNYHIILATTH
ncbi:hypothetical protein BGW36DRAFT_365364 [Talaromyces proteolyticus]|uniref:C3H1-type domain-containing protein n=1 Tax=Talaromyces proteolyticus TaxID=1131652 RepID=A0AAD4PUP3_9EURO|nr:uncharacterized protein BGW36DRAFT_365364 [Talaromyces proteolyticus]KAH8689595.1 hypothetical protein BGW36DRAFT_365364 [Talaromyces proteolyticus]